MAEVSCKLLGIDFGVALGCNFGSREFMIFKNFGNIQATGQVKRRKIVDL